MLIADHPLKILSNTADFMQDGDTMKSASYLRERATVNAYKDKYSNMSAISVALETL